MNAAQHDERGPTRRTRPNTTNAARHDERGLNLNVSLGLKLIFWALEREERAPQRSPPCLKLIFRPPREQEERAPAIPLLKLMPGQNERTRTGRPRSGSEADLLGATMEMRETPTPASRSVPEADLLDPLGEMRRTRRHAALGLRLIFWVPAETSRTRTPLSALSVKLIFLTGGNGKISTKRSRRG